jgi:hypothetical protein
MARGSEFIIYRHQLVIKTQRLSARAGATAGDLIGEQIAPRVFRRLTAVVGQLVSTGRS